MTWTRVWVVALALGALGMLGGCGGVKVHPEPVLPQPLIQPLPASVGLVLGGELRNYTHKETRWGVDWNIELGPGHMRLMRDVFKDRFAHVEEFKDLDAARSAKDLKALFEPQIEQYSFVTARETGGRYYAVTIRYRILLYSPAGEKIDALTLTGYGNALAKGMSSGVPLVHATLSAMRDAAAKFLVQFPDQPAGQQLARNEPLTVQQQLASASSDTQIEAVPIDDPVPDTDSLPTAQVSGAPSSPAPSPSAASSGGQPAGAAGERPSPPDSAPAPTPK